MDQRIARDSGGRGEDKRHDQANDGGADRLEQYRQDAEGDTSGEQPDQAGAGLVGELRGGLDRKSVV